MKTLRISPDLALPLDAVTRRIAWMGSTGSGKTFGCKRMVEQMLHARAQVVILDGMGVWAGLRLGPKPFDVPVFGGLYGDIPLEPTAGALVADVIVDRGTSIVLDVSQMLDAERTRFATGFGQRFFQRKKAAPSAVHVVLEECQEFVPENYQHGEERMLHEFVRISKQGRTFGMGVSFISQRPQEVSKKALNQSDCVFAFQMSGTQERKALQSWLSDQGIEEKLSDILPHIEVGAPRVWSPRWLKVSKDVRILPIESLDTSATPKVGEKAFALRKLGPIDLKELTAAMAETVERAKAEDPRALRARIAELEKELRRERDAISIPKVEIERVEVPAFDEAAFNKAYEGVLAAIDRAGRVVAEVRGAAASLLDKYQASVMAQRASRAPIFAQTRSDHMPKAATPRANPAPNYSQSRPSMPKADGGPSGAERRLLIALAQYGRPMETRKLALRAGYSVNGHFSNTLGALRTKGWAQGRGEVVITAEGLAAVGEYERLPTGAELLSYWKDKLGKAEGALLSALEGGETLPTSELAARAGYTVNGHFSNTLGHLRSLELVIGRGSVRISEELVG